MKTFTLVFFLLLAAGYSCAGPMRAFDADNSAPRSANTFLVGLWKGEYQGQTFVVIRLGREGQKLTGTIAMGNINVDERGEVDEVTSEAREETKMIDVRENTNSLTFKVKDGNDVAGYEMELLEPGGAKLRIVGAPSNVQPFKLKKSDR